MISTNKNTLSLDLRWGQRTWHSLWKQHPLSISDFKSNFYYFEKQNQHLDLVQIQILLLMYKYESVLFYNFFNKKLCQSSFERTTLQIIMSHKLFTQGLYNKRTLTGMWMRTFKPSSPASQQDLQASCCEQEFCKSEPAGERKICTAHHTKNRTQGKFFCIQPIEAKCRTCNIGFEPPGEEENILAQKMFSKILKCISIW